MAGIGGYGYAPSGGAAAGVGEGLDFITELAQKNAANQREADRMGVMQQENQRAQETHDVQMQEAARQNAPVSVAALKSQFPIPGVADYMEKVATGNGYISNPGTPQATIRQGDTAKVLQLMHEPEHAENLSNIEVAHYNQKLSDINGQLPEAYDQAFYGGSPAEVGGTPPAGTDLKAILTQKAEAENGLKAAMGRNEGLMAYMQVHGKKNVQVVKPGERAINADTGETVAEGGAAKPLPEHIQEIGTLADGRPVVLDKTQPEAYRVGGQKYDLKTMGPIKRNTTTVEKQLSAKDKYEMEKQDHDIRIKSLDRQVSLLLKNEDLDRFNNMTDSQKNAWLMGGSAKSIPAADAQRFAKAYQEADDDWEAARTETLGKRKRLGGGQPAGPQSAPPAATVTPPSGFANTGKTSKGKPVYYNGATKQYWTP